MACRESRASATASSFRSEVTGSNVTTGGTYLPGKVGGAALDVFETEPLPASGGGVFAGCPNLILTPHIAGGMGETNKPITLDLPEGVPPDVILQPHETEEAGRHAALRYLSRPIASHAPRIAETAIELAKLSRLLPAVVLGQRTGA